MSAPHPSIRDGEEIGYGFVAAKACVALDHVLREGSLSDADRAALTPASQFLKDIADGAAITMGGVREGVSASRSMAALDVAFGPLETLKRLVRDEAEIAPVFLKLSESLEELSEGRKTSAALKTELVAAQQFFDSLSSWLIDELGTRSRALDHYGSGLLMR